MASRNATDLVLGNAWVWPRRPAPGSTGSAAGDGRGFGFGFGRGLGVMAVTDGVALTCVRTGVLLRFTLTGLAGVLAPPEQLVSRKQAASGTMTAAAHRRGLRTPTSRHLMEIYDSGSPQIA
jgi:hypothetical protein